MSKGLFIWRFIRQKALKIYSIHMQDIVPMNSPNLIDSEDEEALALFNHIQPDLPHQQSPAPHHPSPEVSSDEDAPQLNRLSRLNKLSKQDKKKHKIKEKKDKKKLKKKRHFDSPAPHKKVKREKSTKKKSDNDEEERHQRDDRGSSQFDSSDNDDLAQGLNNLNPDLAQDTPKKKLVKSARKQKYQDRQGFKLSELGNDAEIALSEDEEYSFEPKKKKSSKKKLRVAVPTNEEIMNAFKQHGVVESEGEDDHRQYDRGFDVLNQIKKKSKDSIRVNNRLFGDLQIKLEQQQVQVEVPENFDLELKQKNSTASSQRVSFLSKAETIKKLRGFQANVNLDEFNKKAQEKAKKSIAKLVNSLANDDFHQDLDLQIRIPSVSRGRSSDIINNTVFLKQNIKKSSEDSQQPHQFVLKQTKSLTLTTTTVPNPRKDVTRRQFYRGIQEETRLKRSKYISNQELKNSFKKSGLEQLQQARRKIQEKRKQQAFSSQSSGDELDSQMKQMIEKEQKACGDISEPEEEDIEIAENQSKADKPQCLEQQAVQSVHDESELQRQQIKNKVQVINQELEQYNQMLEELKSVSDIKEVSEQEQVNEEELDQSQSILENPELQEVAFDIEPPLQNEEIIEQAEESNNLEKEREMRELEEEGIIVRKRRKHAEPNQKHQTYNAQNYIIQPIETEKEKPESEQKDKVAEGVPLEEGARIQSVESQQFANFKKLRKIAMVIARKKKEREEGRQYAAEFIEHEAEEGSDNQEHDDIVKTINLEAQNKEYEGLDLDADLEELIDNAVDINEDNQHEAFRKYIEDVRQQDRDDLKKIIRGEFWKKHQDLQLQIEEDQKNRQQRIEQAMEWMKQREEEEGKDIYLKSPERDPDSDADSQYSRKATRKEDESGSESESEQVPYEEQVARLNQFLEDTMPSAKREIKPVGELNLLPLPESVKRDKKVGLKTISSSKFGSRGGAESTPLKLGSRAGMSSLVNQILSKHLVAKPRQMLGAIKKKK